MIDIEHGDYYRILLMRVNHNTTGNLSTQSCIRVKTDYTRLHSDAGIIAGQWASDLPHPTIDHFVTIQYVEAC